MNQGLFSVLVLSGVMSTACPPADGSARKQAPRCGREYVPAPGQAPPALDEATALRILSEDWVRALWGVSASFSTRPVTCEPRAPHYEKGSDRVEALRRLSAAGLMTFRGSGQAGIEPREKCGMTAHTFEPVHGGECLPVSHLEHSHGSDYSCGLGTLVLEKILRIDPPISNEAVVTGKMRFEPTPFYRRASEAIAANEIEIRRDIRPALGPGAYWPTAADMARLSGAQSFRFELCDDGWQLRSPYRP